MGFEADHSKGYPFNESNKWDDTIDFFELLRKDYQVARRQLQEVSETLGEREAEIDRHLRQAVLLSSSFRPLCLSSYGQAGTISLMGSTILGETIPLQIFQKPMRLEVRLLGQFELRSEKKQVDQWHSAKAKSVFEYLVTKPHVPVIKDKLMDTLWPECDSESAGNNLKTAVYGLKRTLTNLFNNTDNFPYIIFIQGGYLINQALELWIDVEEFEKHWMLGRGLEKQGRLDEAAHEFEIADSLYRGDYLEDEPYEDWTLRRREALKDTYVSILGRLADYSIETADYEGCIVYCQKILVKDPCREDAYRRLMRCHSRLGRRNRALDWFKICKHTIQSELDTLPDPETIELGERLRRNEAI